VLVEEVNDGQGDESANGVEEGVPRGGGAGGDEGLVDFVKGGVGSGDKPSGPGPSPAPAGMCASNATKENQIEDEIFSEVRRFADEVVDYRELGSGEVRNEGVEDGVEN